MQQPLLVNLPPDFTDRTRELCAEQEAGADYSLEQIAERLGLPVEFMKVCHAVYLAHVSGQPVLLLPPPQVTSH